MSLSPGQPRLDRLATAHAHMSDWLRAANSVSWWMSWLSPGSWSLFKPRIPALGWASWSPSVLCVGPPGLLEWCV